MNAEPQPLIALKDLMPREDVVGGKTQTVFGAWSKFRKPSRPNHGQPQTP